MNRYFAVAVIFAGSLALTACGPKYTYPSNTVVDSIENISQKEYKIDVIARVVGKTVGAVFYMEDLVDPKGQVPKEVHEKMGKVMQAVTRVALSSDLPVDFVTVLLRGKKDGNELVITRSLDDTKRANADAIGVEESINRTIFGQNRYPIETLPEAFVLKEVKIEQFLADQVAQRIRFNFAKEAKDESAQFALVDGQFDATRGRIFRFSVIGMKAEQPTETVLGILKTVSDVLGGYKFTGFDSVEIQDYLNRQKLIVPANVIDAYHRKKITDAEILATYLSQSQSIQEAFKLFGFNLPQDQKEDPKAVPLKAATP